MQSLAARLVHTPKALMQPRGVCLTGIPVTLRGLCFTLPPHHNCCGSALPNVQENPHSDRKRFAVKIKYADGFPLVLNSNILHESPFTEKKPKQKKEKEKPSDVISDGISDLLAQMTLQSSSSTPQQMHLPTTSNTDEPAVVLLDTPVSQKSQRKSKEDPCSLSDSMNTPAATTSPSVSAVIDALHLSDIDWDALSFTSSPPPQSAANHNMEPGPSKTTDGEVKDTESTERKNTGDVKEADSRAAAEFTYTECPLRERVLIRNTAKAVGHTHTHHTAISKKLNRESAAVKHTSSQYSDPKPNPQTLSRGGSDDAFLGKGSALHVKGPLTDRRQYATNQAELGKQKPRQHLQPAAQPPSKTSSKHNASQKPPEKYTFTRKDISSLLAPPQRNHSDPGQSERNVPQTTKKSVCMSAASSSEESDAENQQLGPQRKAKIKPINRIKRNFLLDFPLQPVSGPKTTNPTSAHAASSARLKAQSCGVDIDESGTPASAKSTRQELSPANEKGDVFAQSPASPVVVSDSDDSVICSESPLPLAERLKLKFLK